MGKAMATLKKLEDVDLRAEYLELIEESEQARNELNVINREIDLIVEAGKLKGINLLKEYGNNKL